METKELISKYQTTGDKCFRNKAVEDNMGLVRTIVKRFSHNVDKEELFQVGAIGMIEAVERFDVDRGYALSTFAYPTVRGRIQKFLWRDSNLGPAHNQQLSKYYQLKGDNPQMSDKEITEKIGITQGELAGILDYNNLDSLDRKITNGEGKKNELGEFVAGSLRESSIETMDLFSVLDKEEFKVLHEHFVEGYTQQELAERYSTAQSTISRRLSRYIRKVTDHIQNWR